MNKRFSTLLAAALVAGSLSANAQLVTVGSAAAGATTGGAAATFVPGEYYYLKGAAGGVTGGVEYLTYLKGNVTTDSLAVVDDADLTTSEATDRALWKVVMVKNPATSLLSHWTFENKHTGTLLANGSVNAFQWIADVPATDATVAATILKSTQGLDLTKGEHYEFREVITLNEKYEETGASSGAGTVTLDELDTDNKGTKSLQLVKFKGADIVGVWDNSTAITANKTISGIIYATTDNAAITGAITKDKKVTVAAGTKIVLNKSTENNGLTAQPFVPGYDLTLTATKGDTKGSLANVIAPKKYTSFKFTGLESSTANVLATNEFELVELTVKGYSNATSVATNQSTTTIDVLRAKAKDAKGRALYLRMDTAMFAGGDYFKVKLDTMTTDATGAIIAAPKAVMHSYAFGVKYHYADDSVSIYPKFTLDKASDLANWSDSSTVTIAANTAAGNVLAIKQFSSARELTLVDAVAEGAKYTFGDITPGGGVASFEDGVSYYIQRANKAATDANSGKFYAHNFYGTAQYADSAYYLPATQWTVKEVSTGHYTVKNRETGAALTGVTADDGEVLYTAEAENVIAIGTDTLKFIKAPALANNKYLGYMNLKEEDYRNKAYSISFTDYNSITTFVNTADSVLKASDEGVYFKLAPVSIEGAFGADTLVRSAYYISDKEGKKFITYRDAAKTGYKLSETDAPVKFLFRNVGADSYSLIDSVTLAESQELIIDIKTGAVRPVKVGSAVTFNAFDILTEAAPEYVLDAKGHYNIENLRGDMLAADAKGFGMFRKEGELKAAYEKNDFSLYIDTAKIHAIEPSYFILSGAKTGEGSALEGNFLRVMTDSIAVEGYKADNGLTRLAFVPAKREATSDSLLVNFQNEVLTEKDSVGYKNQNEGKIGQFQFKIQYTNVEGEYLVENVDGKYLATYNDVLCSTSSKDAAQLIKLTKVDAPTSNEGVEVSEMTIIAGEGNVTIAGAAGKKVVISNILGQVVANTVLSSDNATIAAPAGVVVVAVEGEEAVKAIVK